MLLDDKNNSFLEQNNSHLLIQKMTIFITKTKSMAMWGNHIHRVKIVIIEILLNK